MFSGLVVREVVQQDGAEDGTFGFYVGRKTVRETVISGSQDLITSLKELLEMRLRY
jgi:hypothetical protein